MSEAKLPMSALYNAAMMYADDWKEGRCEPVINACLVNPALAVLVYRHLAAIKPMIPEDATTMPDGSKCWVVKTLDDKTGASAFATALCNAYEQTE